MNASIMEARTWFLQEVTKENIANLLLTVFTELAQNIIKYAERGQIKLSSTDSGDIKKISVVSTDYGPGINNIDNALLDNFSTSGTLGLGLPGIKRIMDELVINSEPGKGTEIRAVKYI